MCARVYVCLCVQLSIYASTQPNAAGGHTLIHKEDKFDVGSKFERFAINERMVHCQSVFQLNKSDSKTLTS